MLVRNAGTLEPEVASIITCGTPRRRALAGPSITAPPDTRCGARGAADIAEICEDRRGTLGCHGGSLLDRAR